MRDSGMGDGQSGRMQFQKQQIEMAPRDKFRRQRQDTTTGDGDTGDGDCGGGDRSKRGEQDVWYQWE